MEFFCLETEAKAFLRAYPDTVLLDDDRVLQNLLISEDRYTISSSYFKCIQTDLKPYMRKMVATWMLEVCEEERCQEEIFPLAMNYLDRFLSIVRIRKSQLQLLGTVCLLLSSKLRQTPSLQADKLVLYTDNSVTLEEIRDWEILVLSRLKWDLCAITPNDFLEHIFRRMPLGGLGQAAVRRHAHIFIALCATDFKFSMYPPSMIAAASLGAAIQGLYNQFSSCELLSQLHSITGIEVDCLRECLEQIETMIRTQQSSANQSDRSSTNASGENEAGQKMSSNDSQDTRSSPLVETPTDVQDINF